MKVEKLILTQHSWGWTLEYDGEKVSSCYENFCPYDLQKFFEQMEDELLMVKYEDAV